MTTSKSNYNIIIFIIIFTIIIIIIIVTIIIGSININYIIGTMYMEINAALVYY